MAFKPALKASVNRGAQVAPLSVMAKRTTPSIPNVDVNSSYVKAILNRRTYKPNMPHTDSHWVPAYTHSSTLTKSATSDPADHTLRDTATIFGAGLVSSGLQHKIMNSGVLANKARNAMLVGGALGLAGDFGAVKLNKALATPGPTNTTKPMNKVAQMLRERADEIRSSNEYLVALGHLKAAGVSEAEARLQLAQVEVEKSAMESLTFAGIDMDLAASMVKSAGVPTELAANLSTPSEDELLADQFEKLAEYIESQQEELDAALSTVADLESALANTSTIHEAPGLSKMAQAGVLTMEEVTSLRTHVPAHTIEKLANAIDRPWELGQASSVSDGASGDPLLDFINGA